MAKKSRISKEAFDWVKDTSKAEEKKSDVPKPEIEPEKQTAIPKKSKGKRTIMVRYKKDGTIISIMEIPELTKADERPYLSAAGDEKADEFILSGQLADKELIDIHNNYKVATSGKEPKLVAKK